MQRLHTALLAALALGTPSLAHAQEPLPTGNQAIPGVAPVATPEAPAAPAAPPKKSWTDTVQVGGRIFLGWSWNLTEGMDNANTFDLTRAYLFAKVKLADHVKARLTLDAPAREPLVTVSGDPAVTKVTSGAGRFDVVLKHAYLEVDQLWLEGLSLKLGMHDTPWLSYEEAQSQYRFASAMFADREGYMSSTDLGLMLGYELPSKLFAAQVSLVNGETWQKPEVTGSAHKDVITRLTFVPLRADAGTLSLSLVGSVGEYDKADNRLRLRLIGQLAWEAKNYRIAAEFMRTADRASALTSRQASLARSNGVATGQGISAYAWLDTAAFNVADGLRFFFRFDMLDPDTEIDKNSHTRELFGVGYRLNDNFQFMVDGEWTQFDADAGATVGSKPVTEKRVSLHTDISF